MIIKSEKGNMEQIVIMFGCIAAFIILMAVGVKCSMGFLFACAFILLFGAMRYWIATGRTLIMDEEGCTVCFGWYRKKYKWDELKVKRMEDYRNAFGHRSPYTKGVIFSPYTIHKPKWLKPDEYSKYVRPFTFFFVYFPPEKRTRANGPALYTIDEVVFLEKMKIWNVKLENIF